MDLFISKVIFFELMPCALEAQTVIKTFCLKIVHLKGEEVVCVKEQHQVRGREGRLKSKGHRPAKSRETFLERPTSLSQTWIGQITLDRSMAATGREEAGGGSLWIRITLDSSGRGGQRGVGEVVKRREEVSNPALTSMVVSWTVSMHRAPTRGVIEGGGRQARANLNGRELDKEPFLRDERGQTTMTWV